MSDEVRRRAANGALYTELAPQLVAAMGEIGKILDEIAPTPPQPEYIHSNDRRNPDCLPPIEPPDAATRRSPVEVALSKRYIDHYRLTDSWALCWNGMCVALWPSREGTYGAAIGAQYAERRHDGGHGRNTSIEALMEHPLLQRPF